MVKLSEVIEAIGAAIPSVPTFVGRAKRTSHKSHPSYAWEPIGGAISGPRHPTVQQPPLIGFWPMRWEVDCWGKDMDEATLLVAALLTAAQEKLGGRRFSIPRVEASPKENALGFCWVVTFEIFLDLPRTNNTALPIAASASTAEIDTVEQATPATSTSGDNQLEGTET